MDWGCPLSNLVKGLSHSVHGSGVFFAKKTPGRHLNVFPSWLGVRGWGFGTVQIHINNFENFWFFLWRAFFLLPQIVKIEAKLGRLSADNQKMLKIDFLEFYIVWRCLACSTVCGHHTHFIPDGLARSPIAGYGFTVLFCGVGRQSADSRPTSADSRPTSVDSRPRSADSRPIVGRRRPTVGRLSADNSRGV